LSEEGKTIFLTTHYMDEAQTLADRVAIIVDGRIVAEGPPGALQGDATVATTIEFSLAPGLELPPDLATGSDRTEGRYVIATDAPMKVLHDLTGWALERDAELEGLTVARPSLEDVYLELTTAAEEATPE
jgi:ABC-2 type transport system ATP-binding protein